MRLHGGRPLRVDRERVWAALHDVECLRVCVPGCVALRRLTPSRFEVDVRLGLGPVTIPFSGRIDVDNGMEPRALSLRGFGEAALAGEATGAARIVLRETCTGCYLAYTIEVERSGSLAFVGAPLLAGIGRGLVDRFASSFVAWVEAPHAKSVPRQPADLP